MNRTDRYLLGITRPGCTDLAAAVTSLLTEKDCVITELAQLNDIQTGQFFCRVELCKPESGLMPAELSNRFSAFSERFGVDWKFFDLSVSHRALILVSKFDHYLDNLSYRKQPPELNIDITTVASNHPYLEAMARFLIVSFKVLPADGSKFATKATQEERIRELIEGQGVDLVLLARYMQVLSKESCQNPAERCFNIYQSFSSSSDEARSFHEAYERGEEAIGATAHYGTLDLDEGPIIDQEVARVDHTCRLGQLLATGRNIENYSFSREVRANSEHRVFLNGHKTVVLK